MNFWQKEQETGKTREELKQAMPFADDFKFALLIPGIRRAGKTFLCKQMLKEKISLGIEPAQTLYANFEDPSLEPYLSAKGLDELYREYRYFINKDKQAFIVLDEIQDVKSWEKWVRIMLEKNENAKFILTGSSSRLLSKRASIVMTGRKITFTLFPLTLGNFFLFKEYEQKRFESYASMEFLLSEYIEYGGFPAIVLCEKERKRGYLKELFDDIVLKDIAAKYGLNETEVRKLAILLINSFSSLISVKRLKEAMAAAGSAGISPTTINRYLGYFAETSLFLFVPVFSYKIRESMRYPRKAYCIDTGLINAVTLKFSENIGRLYENMVAVQLARKHGIENIFYWKDSTGEVDFVIKVGANIKSIVQVCYGIKSAREREISSLLQAGKEMKCDSLLVITMEEEGEESVSGKTIRYAPLWKWLLE
ncbi:MAG: ATP-binding protein [Nanoarchaeota archaeon]|nr:ATP-binding protein [Nanoarchaeota archaeon]